MALDRACADCEVIADLICKELELIQSQEPFTAIETANTYAGGISQLALLRGPLLIAALDLELELGTQNLTHKKQCYN